MIREESVIRADLAKIELGQSCVVGKNSVIHPSLVSFPKGVAFLPLKIGSFVLIKQDCVVSSVSIGNHVYVGARSILVKKNPKKQLFRFAHKNSSFIFQNSFLKGKKSQIKDCSVIMEDSVISEGTIVPSFTVWKGSPAKCVARLSPSFSFQFQSSFSTY